MKIKRHIPNFVDTGQDPEEVEFQTTEELLNIPWVKTWSESNEFFRYSISANYPGHSLLMAELELGVRWWVIGYLHMEEDDKLDLPRWIRR